MASVAERKRQRRAATAARAADAAAAKASGQVEAARPSKTERHGSEAKYTRKRTALQWIYDKGRLGQDRYLVLELYGAWWRLSKMDSAAIIKSNINFDEGRGGGGTKLFPGEIDYSVQADIARAKGLMPSVDLALSFSPGLIAACVAVAGKDQLPREFVDTQREAEEVEACLRIAADRLASHLRDINVEPGAELKRLRQFGRLQI